MRALTRARTTRRKARLEELKKEKEQDKYGKEIETARGKPREGEGGREKEGARARDKGRKIDIERDRTCTHTCAYKHIHTHAHTHSLAYSFTGEVKEITAIEFEEEVKGEEGAEVEAACMLIYLKE